jgi:Flp pilus assembly protein TadG
MVRHAAPSSRRGAGAPFAAFLLIVLIGMVAFVVDIGWIILARTELQAAADAAALAGADPLMDAYVQYQMAGAAGQASNQSTILTNAMKSARLKAEAFASYNGAGGVSSLTLNDGDVEFGYTDGSGNYTAYSSGQPFPNTVKVTLRMDSSANGPLGLFFAPAIGTGSTNLKAVAAAVLTGGTINNFKSLGQNIGVLPVTYDVNNWNNFVKTGQWPDGTTSADANGVPQLQVYPCIQDVGNFGILSLDDSHIGASTIDGWIQSGMAPADLASLQAAGLVPLSSHNPNSWDWSGDTGFKSSNVQTMNNYIGTTFVLPLFTPYSAASSAQGYQAGTGTGSGYNYNIVQFVGVRIVQPPNANRQVYLEPAAVVAPAAVFSSGGFGTVDTSQTGSVVTTFSYPRLSQ